MRIHFIKTLVFYYFQNSWLQNSWDSALSVNTSGKGSLLKLGNFCWQCNYIVCFCFIFSSRLAIDFRKPDCALSLSNLRTGSAHPKEGKQYLIWLLKDSLVSTPKYFLNHLIIALCNLQVKFTVKQVVRTVDMCIALEKWNKQL